MSVMSNDVSLGLVHEVEVMLRKVGATRENFWKPVSKSEELARKVLKLVTARPSYDIVVNCNRSRAEMIKAGKYDWTNDDINEKNFPFEGKGERKESIILFHFNKTMQSDDVIVEIDKEGYRPANADEILALGEKHPSLQREFPIIALGSVWRYPDGDRRVVALWNVAGERSLFLRWFKGGWNDYFRFAAVRK